MSTSHESPLITPGHIQRAKAALRDAGTPVAVGHQALDLATAFYHETPQVSQADALRRERNRIEDGLESVSSQLQQERQKTQRLEQVVADALAAPKSHQKKAYRLRKQLRSILAVPEHPQAKEATKLNRIAKLVAGVLTGGDDDPDLELNKGMPHAVDTRRVSVLKGLARSRCCLGRRQWGKGQRL